MPSWALAVTVTVVLVAAVLVRNVLGQTQEESTGMDVPDVSVPVVEVLLSLMSPVVLFLMLWALTCFCRRHRA